MQIQNFNWDSQAIWMYVFRLLPQGRQNDF